MKNLLIIFFTLYTAIPFAQIPKSGTYIYNYCDMEYNKCIGKCTIKIKGNNIWIYAPANLTGIKEGELYESGTLHKDRKGRWIITPYSSKDKTTPTLNTDDGPPLWIDFKRKRFWTF
ncbi:hypothetical protein [Ferruginibacter sp. SUN106]|uniref:hypothetical protein n=1 Tax=Ferruginibacter sp. SUN106 TaxID=2978348 RepID=UPI003D36A795